MPFNTVFFHGLIRDAQGRKMSKSLGNGVDPLDVISVYGADALRFTLVTGNSPGNDLRFSEEKVSASRNFANKIWNAARFILMNIEGKDIDCALPKKLYTSDKWILNRFNNVTAAVTENLEKFELGMAVSKLYDFIWDDFCDWYIELAKIRMNGADEESADSARRVLVWTMSNTLKLLHPFMPYITEEICRRCRMTVKPSSSQSGRSTTKPSPSRRKQRTSKTLWRSSVPSAPAAMR